MFGRRVPPQIVFMFSVVLALLCAIGAVATLRAGNWVWFAILGGLTVWFTVDAVRSYGWARNKKRLDAEKAAQNARHHPQR
ncbi:hypothetical protein [Deinococcus koreensis]|uniref:Uncharacterized protein n=1 Tax=Deinococcus koreensis TaxID=2054903 RepID=A0A2K3UYM3_9DEIO|nr:hypothetical protein [Deinococcus koreensis]PNY81639.1 hypothetical protein CVO96_09875 [Deinococcus koreensis]